MKQRLPNFDGYCYHVTDQITPLNGGRFNLDLYLRVLRERAQGDITIAFRGQPITLPEPLSLPAKRRVR